MKLIANEEIKAQVVQIDNHHFENCTIVQSVLVFSGGDFSWTNCRFANCQIRFTGAAQRTIQFLRHFGMVPQKAPDRAETTGSSSVH